MFEPTYQLTAALLGNLVRIKNLIAELNAAKFPELVLAAFEKESYAVSAHASTSIEGNPLPLTDVRNLLKQTPEHIRDTEKEVLNYNRALHYLREHVTDDKPVTETFIRNVQALVTTEVLEKKHVGKFRTEPVVVNDPRKRIIAYIPPNASDVPELMSQLTAYLEKNDELDPLLLAGLFHKQFVVIHPFMDGNGRTARLVTKYVLARMGLDTFQLFSFENYYNQHVTNYFASVGVYGDYYEIAEHIDFTDWLVYFTDGIIDELLRVQKLLQKSVTLVRPREYEKVIMRYLEKHGSISRKEYEQITDRARSTQILDFKRLVDAGAIVRHEKGKATYYTLP